MFIRLIVSIVVLFVAVGLIQMVLVRTRGLARAAPRPSARWDVPPILAFIGAVLLALAFVEAARREVMDAWRWGIALGLVLGAGAWLAALYRAEPTPRESTGRAAWRWARTYGVLALIALAAVYLSVRVVGAVMEVFIAGVAGVALIAAAVGVFVREWRGKTQNAKHKTQNSEL